MKTYLLLRCQNIYSDFSSWMQNKSLLNKTKLRSELDSKKYDEILTEGISKLEEIDL